MNEKVCHITSAHNRYDVRIFMKQCKSLASNGYDVYLIVNDDEPDEIIDNVKIISTGIIPKNRFDRFMNSRKKIMCKAIEVNADIYQLHDPDLLTIGNKLRKMNRKVIFDSHEDVSQQIKDKEWIPVIIRVLISKIYLLYEKSSVRKYNAVISVTPHIVERFESVNVNSIMVTNYPIIDENENKYRKPISAICFAGGITEQWSHHRIIKAIEDIDGMKYLLAGSGTNDYLMKLQSMPGWDKVELKGKVPFSEVKNIYSMSIAGMALNYSKQAEERGTLGNTKLFEFMEAKVPVICTDYLLWKEIIDKFKCGICVNPNNVNDIRSAIYFIINNPDKAVEMGENGRKAVLEKFNWKTQEKVLIELYQSF